MAEHRSATGLGKLIKGIQNAVIKAQELMRKQHLNQMAEYVDEGGNPICIDVKIPVPGPDGLQMRDTKVPKMVLAPPSALKLEKLSMEFDVTIQGLSEDHDCEDHEVHIQMSRGLFGRSTKAKCKVVFTGDDPPEGFMRLNDELLKFL